MPIEHLILKSAKKCLHDTVVIAVPFARHGLDDVMFFKALSEVLMLILPALVRMEDQTVHMGKIFKCCVEHSLVIKNLLADVSSIPGWEDA